jgi:hypothetical protein
MMSDEGWTMNAGRHRMAESVETMLKLHKDLPALRVGGGFKHKEVA